MNINITYTTQAQTASSTVFIVGKVDLQLDTLLAHVVLSVLCMVTLYLLVALIVHYHRSANTCTVISVLHVCTALFGLMGMLLQQVSLTLATESNVFCHYFSIVFVAFYFLGILSTFTLFWFRQKFLYATSSLRPYNGKWWRCVSTFIIVGIYGFMLPMSVVISQTFDFQSTKYGCRLISTVGYGIMILLVLVTSTVFFQLALLLLMIYPLKKVNPSNNSAMKSTKMLIRRLIVCTAVAIASELVGGAVAAVCLVLASNSSWFLVAHMDILANVFAITGSFVNWKKKLFPFGKIRNRN